MRSTTQPNALGKLAFDRTDAFTTGSTRTSLRSVNADGTKQSTLAAAGTPPLYCGEPSFSSDGTKILFTMYAGFTTTANYQVRTVSPSGGDGQLLFTGGTRADWQPIRAAIRSAKFDFDGDGKADLAVVRGGGSWYLSGTTQGFVGIAFGNSTDLPIPNGYVH